jgi:hypothetical protein
MDRITKPVIAVVDDDSGARESLTSLIESAGLTARVFSLAKEFLQEGFPGEDQLFDYIRPNARDGRPGFAALRPARTPGPSCHLHHSSSR